MTKLASALPKGTANGLDAIAGELVDAPEGVHVCVMLVDCKKVTTDFDSGDVVPTARVRTVEVITGEDRKHVHAMLRRALETRMGKTVLPFEIERDITAAFGNVDPDTGEIRG